MRVRQILLLLILAALGTCAVLGVFAVGLRTHDELVFGVLFLAISVVAAALLMLPLTFLVDRPKLRAGGVGAMVLIAMALPCVCGLILSEFIRRLPGWGRLDDACGVMLGLTLLYGVPAVGGLFLARFRWGRFSAWTLAGTAVLALAITALGAVAVFQRMPNDLDEKVLATGAFIYVAGFLASLLLVNAGCGDWRLFRYPAVFLALAAMLLPLIAIWGEMRGGAGEFFVKIFVILMVVTVFCAQLNLLLMGKVQGAALAARWVAVGTSALCCLLIMIAIIPELDELVGVIFALGILSMCASLALIVLALMQRRYDYREEQTATQLKEIDLTCPRCQRKQLMPVGDGACVECGLKVLIKAIEPRCPECRYLLYGAGLVRCPECGAGLGAGPAKGVVSGATAPVESPVVLAGAAAGEA